MLKRAASSIKKPIEIKVSIENSNRSAQSFYPHVQTIP